MASLLLTDGSSPMYSEEASCSLAATAGSTIVALEPPPGWSYDRP
jgi:hypothetical protein